MNRRFIGIGVVACAAGLTGLNFIAGLMTSGEPGPIDPRSAEAKEATEARVEAGRTYSTGNHKKAANELRIFINQYEGSSDSDTQDQVAAARMTIGYIQASQKDFTHAKETFKELEAKYTGTGAENPEFGKVTDQAAYQAIVCLQAEGKTDEAVVAYVAFLKDHWDSPLIYAVHKRLRSLGPKEKQEEYERILQESIDKQDKKIRHDLAMCGPNALAYFMRLLSEAPKTVDELAKLCKTTDDGTTMANMAGAFSILGYEAKGYNLNL